MPKANPIAQVMINSHFPNLFKSGEIGNVKIKNRIVMAAMGTTFWGVHGEVTERTIDYYVARARGGVGLITVGFASVSYPDYYRAVASLESENFIPGHNRLVEKLHDYGARVSLQINHTGRAGVSHQGQQLVSSSPVRNVRLGEVYPVPRALRRSEIYQIIELFAAIAERAKRAGYDMVEIHGAHGYLVNSFISPYLNIRDDEFGGSLENRMRFPIEILKRIKDKVGDAFPVGIRISGDEFIDGGVTVKESPVVAQMMEKAGASFIHVSAGMDEVKDKQIDIMRASEGWKSYIWKAVKNAVTIPTFAAGGNRTPEYCESLLAEGGADYVALARQLLADNDWPEKAKQGKLDDIRYCISCLECMGYRMGRAVNTHCSINIALGREAEYGEIKPAGKSRRIAVIGSGPAGLEASRVAALRGHQVVLYEKNQKAGGQLLLAATPPGKQKINWFLDYEINQLQKLGISVELGTVVTPELIRELGPDAVIIATGSEPCPPVFKGAAGNKRVMNAREALSGERLIMNRRVVVVGGGIVGAETAEFLAERGNTVTIVEMLPRIAADMEMHNRKGLLDALESWRVTVLGEHEVSEITEGGLIVFNKNNKKKRLIKADLVVLATGSRPVDGLARELQNEIPRLYLVGDCLEPRTILKAVYEGAVAAMQI